jgi:hypothetical protein
MLNSMSYPAVGLIAHAVVLPLLTVPKRYHLHIIPRSHVSEHLSPYLVFLPYANFPQLTKFEGIELGTSPAPRGGAGTRISQLLHRAGPICLSSRHK